MTNEELHDKEPRSSTEIESDIRKTRGRMDATLDELGNRLTARSLLNSALDWWESRSTEKIRRAWMIAVERLCFINMQAWHQKGILEWQ